MIYFTDRTNYFIEFRSLLLISCLFVISLFYSLLIKSLIVNNDQLSMIKTREPPIWGRALPTSHASRPMAGTEHKHQQTHNNYDLASGFLRFMEMWFSYSEGSYCPNHHLLTHGALHWRKLLAKSPFYMNVMASIEGSYWPNHHIGSISGSIYGCI